jgi:8-oxo-dGTP pyrophosphatase MutT (NUDIX family)
MNKLQKASKPNFCLTASGYLVHDSKILLIKHKKLQAWLSPGGHIDPGELPHHAAEREFWEETGIKVEAVGYESEDFMPVPFKSGLHWVCKENFERRHEGKKPLKQWKRGCEQHFDLGYFVKPIAGLDYKKNVEETDGIAWFTFKEIEGLNTFADVRKAVRIAFKLAKK